MVCGNHTVEKEVPMTKLGKIFDVAMRGEGFKSIPVGPSPLRRLKKANKLRAFKLRPRSSRQRKQAK